MLNINKMESLQGLTLHQVGDLVESIVKKQQLKYQESFKPCPSSARNFPIDFSTLRNHMARVIPPNSPSYNASDGYTKNLILDYICLWCRTEDKQYFCPNCTQSCPTASKYKEHFRKAHMNFRSWVTSKTPASKIPCGICGKPTYEKFMKTHQRSHMSMDELISHKCDPCGKRFRSKTSLRDHINTKHNQTRTYTCPYCQKQCKSSHLRTSHIHNIHINNPDNNTRYNCSQCSAAFNTKIQLRGHLQLKHTDPSVFGHVECLQCHRKFITPIQLQCHKSYCTANAEGKCVFRICSKNLASKHGLQRHILTHTGELPFKCEAKDCGKRFRTLSTLATHTKTHVERREYSCSDCQLQFRLPHHLRNHLKTLIHAKTVNKPVKVGAGGMDQEELEESSHNNNSHTYFLRRTARKNNI